MLNRAEEMLKKPYEDAVKEIRSYARKGICNDGKADRVIVNDRVDIFRYILENPSEYPDDPHRLTTKKMEETYHVNINRYAQIAGNLQRKTRWFIGHYIRRDKHKERTYYFKKEMEEAFNMKFAEELEQLKEFYKKYTEEWEDEELREYYDDYAEKSEATGLKYILNEILNDIMESEDIKIQKKIIISDSYQSSP